MSKTTKSRRTLPVRTGRINGWGVHRSGTRRVLVGLLMTAYAVTAFAACSRDGHCHAGSQALTDGSTP